MTNADVNYFQNRCRKIIYKSTEESLTPKIYSTILAEIFVYHSYGCCSKHARTYECYRATLLLLRSTLQYKHFYRYKTSQAENTLWRMRWSPSVNLWGRLHFSVGHFPPGGFANLIPPTQPYMCASPIAMYAIVLGTKSQAYNDPNNSNVNYISTRHKLKVAKPEGYPARALTACSILVGCTRQDSAHLQPRVQTSMPVSPACRSVPGYPLGGATR